MNNTSLQFLANKSAGDSRTCVILFHGYGASMQDLYGISDFMDPNKTCDWFFPDGWLAAEGGMGRAWFPIDAQALQMAMLTGQPRDLRDKVPEGFDEAISLTKAFIEERLDNYDRVIIGGFSQGAMITSHIAPMISDKLDGLLLFSGNLIAESLLVDKLREASPIKFFQSHGQQDPVLGFDYAKDLYDLLIKHGHTGDFLPFHGQHEITGPVLEEAGKLIL
ncbi:alpha/beta hydrolase [Parendozoicomonas haliclonae]|uniref:Phospholipase/Carboxylesterase n=1 Tax=Parendozoicomonas haliclonae TaxID=1960125 RepID=A0A1X7AL14_9GAMM|nr:hypothetical protein [Parendozoicomonas haliclonae]SMA48520.1 Phospholipase/Carboxylesterase [Parendozoicomonas haliclonae]